jgi:hypothetical protein
MPNRLAQETSPYLLQHRDNPVDWRPWGSEALAEAGARDVPLLVSIGYSACHWCHVMERESFEDEAIAGLMNERFVCIKVDREERPDVDAIYMEAVQAMTGHGGWPLNVFVTPEQVPFFGGTYFPPDQRHGMPSWRAVLEAVADAWANRRAEIRAGGEQTSERLRGAALLEPATEPLDPAVLDHAVAALRERYDRVNGGFGGAPKFPPASVIEFLLARGEREMSLATLRAIARGGIFDQLGGGFARYAVDATWTVPHFEKMLYDNALLARAYLHGYQLSGDPLLREVCERTLDFMLAELRSPEGGFYAALDADSEGEEGRFYVWTVAQLHEALGADADAAIDFFGSSEAGNFEGAGENVLVRAGEAEPDDIARIRARLLEVRAQRVRPGLDDKQITSWNALAISALADAGAVLERTDYLAAATAAAEFLLSRLRAPDGRLLRTFGHGESRLDGYLEDHAFLLEALLTLYEAGFEARFYAEAVQLAESIIERFGDPQRGGFFSTASDGDELLVRRKELEDNPIPSGSSAATAGLLRLAALSGEARYEDQAVGAIRLVQSVAPAHPQAFAHMLRAIDFQLAQVREVALVGDREGVAALARVVHSRLRPHVVLGASGDGADGDGAVVPLLAGRGPVDGRAAAYVCERFACRMPVTEPSELARELGD